MALLPDPPQDSPKNLHAFWLRDMSERLGLTLEATAKGLVARVPRPMSA
jgi:hypothetical protein